MALIMSTRTGSAWSEARQLPVLLDMFSADFYAKPTELLKGCT